MFGGLFELLISLVDSFAIVRQILVFLCSNGGHFGYGLCENVESLLCWALLRKVEQIDGFRVSKDVDLGLLFGWLAEDVGTLQDGLLRLDVQPYFLLVLLLGRGLGGQLVFLLLLASVLLASPLGFVLSGRKSTSTCFWSSSRQVGSFCALIKNIMSSIKSIFDVRSDKNMWGQQCKK